MNTQHYAQKLFGLCLFICWVSGVGYAQQCASEQIVSLAKVWKYEKYSVKGTYFQPSTLDQADCLNLRPDMSFCHVEDGKEFSGRWCYDKQKNVIVLHYCDRKEVREYKVEKATDDALVLSYKADWKLEMTLYLITGVMV